MATTPPRPAEGTEDPNRDLGFGTVVSRESRDRLLNPDGSFNVRRNGLGFWSSMSVYHALLAVGWGRFFALLVAAYLVLNGLFALGYLACGVGALVGPGGAPRGGFLDAFFFSVQTFSTIGYGELVPAGLAANLLVTTEALVGLMGFALATGLVFARFAHPTARIAFSERAVVAPYRGSRAFEFRIVNLRSSQIIELQATLLFSRVEEDAGRRVRRFYPLELERERVSFFPLSWTIVHPIGETSPLRDLAAEDLRCSEAEFLILLTGYDETFAQTVHARSSYRADEVVWGARFADIFRLPSDGGAISIDVERLSEIEPADPSQLLADRWQPLRSPPGRGPA